MRNHTRNLPLDQWNREFERYIKDELGEAIAEVQKSGGGRTRVEGSGILLLRAMCRMTHTGFSSFRFSYQSLAYTYPSSPNAIGHKEYAKGDGVGFMTTLRSITQTYIAAVLEGLR
jgi:hypothetical protein